MDIEQLRCQAERETAGRSTTRRPSWAPALVLGEELRQVCIDCGWLTPEDKPVARLWAIFSNPTKLGTWQRDHLSNVPLQGHRIRGFELIVGEKRSRKLLIRTLKSESGKWDEEGPWWGRRGRAFELARARLTQFLADPQPQMLAGARVTGRCSRCGAVLTDPASTERGIGPECIKRVAWQEVMTAAQ